jgi:hypothetical protein
LHPFMLEIDIIQYDRDSDRVVVRGYLGDYIETEYSDDLLMIRGSEANISLRMSKSELHRFIRGISPKANPHLKTNLNSFLEI